MRSASDRMASSGSRSSFAARYLDVPGGGGGGDGGEESPRAGSGERDRLLGRPPQGRGGARVSTARAVTYEPGAASFSAGNYARLVGESSLSSQRQASAPAGGMPQLRVPQSLPAIRVPSMPVGGSSALPNTPARSLSLLQVSQLDQVELSVLEVSDSGAARHRRMGRVALLRELNAGARGPGGVSLRVPGLELGELRRVNPSRRVSQGSCALLVRRGCVLVSLEKVNALVTADRVYIVLPSMDSDGAQSTRGSAYHLHPPPRDSSPDVAGNSDTIPKNLPPLYRQLVEFLKQAAEDARLEAENGPLPDAEQTGTPRRRDSKRGLGLVGASPGRSFSSDLPASGLAGDESPPGRKSEVEMNALGADEDGPGIGEPFKVPRSRSADAKMIAPDLASEASVLPFGLRAIDLLLSAAVRMLQQRVERTEIELARALEDVTKKTSLRALEITKQHKGEANKLRSVVQDMDEVLEKRLQDKEDLIAMEVRSAESLLVLRCARAAHADAPPRPPQTIRVCRR